MTSLLPGTGRPLALGLLALLHAALAARAAEPSDASPTDRTAPPTATALDGITVIGTRQARQGQQVGAAEIARSAMPGTNPIKILQKLPGVHFVASDPWGIYEWSTRIAIRGFEQNQLGYMLDGVPLGDNSYANHNGLSPNRAITAENVAQIDLAQGAGALRTASTSNLGGTLHYVSRDPSEEFEAAASIAFGSDRLKRGFARLDSGEHQGLSAYVSAVSADTDKWKGTGEQRQRQFNAKALYAWDAGHRLSLWLDDSRRIETDYQDLSLDLIRRCGLRWDNYLPDWARAVEAADGRFSGCVTTKDDAYYAGRGLRDDQLAALDGSFLLGDATTLELTSYRHRNEGQGHWFTPYIASPTVPIALRVTSYDVERSGVRAALSHSIGRHDLELGLWYEDNVHHAGRSFVYLDGPIDDRRFFRPEEFAGRLFRQRWDTTTRQWYVQDSWSAFDERLRLNAGFKGQSVSTEASIIVAGRAGGRLDTDDRFLPRLGATWLLDERTDLFAGYSENQSAFRPGVNGAWSLSQASFDLSRANARPEESRTLEFGIRTERDTWQASAALYAVQFDNRQLIIVPCPGVLSCPNQFANVGSVSTRGMELALVWTPNERWRWLNSVAYNDSQYDDDYVNRSYTNPVDGSHTVPARGKQVVDTPKQLIATELSYEFGDFRARLGGKYTGKRYYTYTNDAGVGSFWLFDAGLAWERHDVGPFRHLRVALDVTNLLDEDYLATLGSNGFRDSDPNGTFATLLAGAPRQAFVSVRVDF